MLDRVGPAAGRSAVGLRGDQRVLLDEHVDHAHRRREVGRAAQLGLEPLDRLTERQRAREHRQDREPPRPDVDHRPGGRVDQDVASGIQSGPEVRRELQHRVRGETDLRQGAGTSSCSGRWAPGHTRRTLSSAVWMTSSRLPCTTCLPRLRVKFFIVLTGVSEGRASALGSTTMSTTTGPSVWASAAARASRTSPGSSTRMPRAPIAVATWPKSGFTKSVPYGISPASCCSRWTKSSWPLLKMMFTTRVLRWTWVSRSPSPSMVKPPSPHKAMTCRPGKASAAPKAYGEALAIDAQVDEPIIRRSRP